MVAVSQNRLLSLMCKGLCIFFARQQQHRAYIITTLPESTRPLATHLESVHRTHCPLKRRLPHVICCPFAT